MRIGIIGAGQVGLGLGGAFAAAGHDVVYASRTPGERDGLTLEPIPAVARESDAVVLTVPGVAVEDLLAHHAADLDGRLVLDTTNYGGRDSRAETFALHQVPAILAAAPRIRLYRVFCTLGFEHFSDPGLTGEQPDLFYCGPDSPDSADRDIVESLVQDIGLRAVRIGDLDASDIVDGATRLWFALAFQPAIGRDVAFRTLGLDRGGS